jgi:hypothetical protein
MQSLLRQIGKSLAGFSLGGAALFWLPWLLALLFGGGRELGSGGFLRMLGMHLVAVVLLAGAYALLYAVHLLLRPGPHPPRSLRLHFLTGIMGAGLFYLLFPVPFFQSHPFVMVIVVLAVVLLVHYLWERRQASTEKPDWLQ